MRVTRCARRRFAWFLFALASVLAPYPALATGLFGLDTEALFAGACPSPGVLHERDFFTLCFRPDEKIAVWVGYELDGDLLEGSAKRRDNFHADLLLAPANRSELIDYKSVSKAFDRGHMAEAELFRRNDEAMSQSFLLSNMAPQTPTFNRGRWSRLEKDVRLWVADGDRALVFTGNLFLNADEEPIAPQRTIGNGVQVPTHNFKAILWEKDGTFEAIGFLLQNRRKRNPGPNSLYARSIDELEAMLGNDFFGFLSPAVERRIESDFVTPAVFD